MSDKTLDIIRKILFPKGQIRLLAILFIMMLLILSVALVVATGGTHLAYIHVIYLPVLLSGIIFSVTGGAVAGIIAGLLLGPFIMMDVAGMSPQPFASWFSRLLVMASVGGISGFSSWVFRKYLIELDIKRTTDPITNLPNLYGLKERFEEIIKENPAKAIGLVVVELSQLKRVDRALGTEGSTSVVRDVAKELVKRLGDICIVGQLHVKRFLLIVPEKSDVERVLQSCNEIAEITFHYNGIPLLTEIYCGIVNYPTDSEDFSDLAKKAVIAVDNAKKTSKRFGYYIQESDYNAEKNLLLLHRLHSAIQEDKLELAYQPQVNLATGELHGVEALVRWNDPIMGNVSPMDFIPLTEETSLINPYTKWLIRKACKKAKEFSDLKLDMIVALNFSMQNFLDDSVLEFFLEEIKKQKINPENLELEITETAVALNIDLIAEKLENIKKLGVHIAIDDFGTGQASHQYLLKLPIDILKLDKIFIDDIANDKLAAGIVSNSISLAKDLGVKLIAEGIETKEQYDLLKKLGCDIGQGYYIAKPLFEADLSDWISKKKLAS